MLYKGQWGSPPPSLHGVFFGDSRDTAEPLPTTEPQTNNRGELRAALHAVKHCQHNVPTLIYLDSLLPVQGITGKAQKWRRHDWQGCPFCGLRCPMMRHLRCAQGGLP